MIRLQGEIILTNLKSGLRMELFQAVNEEQIDWLLQFVDYNKFKYQINSFVDNYSELLEKSKIGKSILNINSMIQIVNAQSFLRYFRLKENTKGYIKSLLNIDNVYDLKKLLHIKD